VKAFPGYICSIHVWRVRRCGCCQRISLFLSNGKIAEFRACLFCSANERYEILAEEIRARFGVDLEQKNIFELDPHSPLKRILSNARTYTRSFYDPGITPGTLREDGAVCEDITALSLADAAVDLIVSSDVLEHVPSLDKAFSETSRVLRPGGIHLFTVPPRSKTKKRAAVVQGQVRFLEPPEYHCDPLCPKGILAYWDIGPDLPQIISVAGLTLRILKEPIGRDGRYIWVAQRVVS
jgi:SAM-dependent methyltransferase